MLIVGGLLALPGVPGPGIPLVLLGLLLLSDHFTWARRALAWCRTIVRKSTGKDSVPRKGNTRSQIGRTKMFDGLDEEIARDDRQTSPRERWLRYAAVLLLSIALFGGLYFGIKFLE